MIRTKEPKQNHTEKNRNNEMRAHSHTAHERNRRIQPQRLFQHRIHPHQARKLLVSQLAVRHIRQRGVEFGAECVLDVRVGGEHVQDAGERGGGRVLAAEDEDSVHVWMRCERRRKAKDGKRKTHVI